MEAAISSAIESIIAQGGVGYAIAALCIICIIFMSRKVDAARAQCDTMRTQFEEALKAQYEKRIEEFGKILEALNRSTDTATAVKESVDARTESINQLVIGFAGLVRDLENNRQRWADKGAEIMKALGDIEREIESLRRKG